MKGDLKETSLFKIISFKSINEKEKVLQLLINSNTNLNKVARIIIVDKVAGCIFFVGAGLL